ncbi:MAG: 6,7-dimethyl-8-ribityllumazine synthase [Candidatus Nanopelagicaceae bacterium]|nr:6,7-dimethyl-8-ribityllumazine synthase [Candidatus Nanopelagicaceae bacterium]
MAGKSPEVQIKKSPNLKAIVISASWHPDICQSLLDGAVRGFESSGIFNFEIRKVAGSFELPLATQLAFDSGFDIAVVVGLVLRGETPHFDYICQGVTSGIMEVALSRSKPIGFGVLMCDTIEQAKARAGFPDSFEDKGFDSAIAALSVLR